MKALDVLTEMLQSDRLSCEPFILFHNINVLNISSDLTSKFLYHLFTFLHVKKFAATYWPFITDRIFHNFISETHKEFIHSYTTKSYQR